MSLLHPWFLWASGGATALVLGLHLLSRRLREPVAFPTLRFAPSGSLPATEVRLRLGDWRLLLLRLLILLLLGLAFAQPRWVASGSVARLALIDGSAGVARDEIWRETVRSALQGAEVALVYDETPRTASDDIEAIAADAPVGLLSPALIAALRHGESLRDRAERVDLIVVSPFPAAAFDAAALRIRALWPGRIETLRVAPADLPATRVELHWNGESAGLDKPLWRPLAQPEPHPGLHAPVATLIAPFERRWALAQPLEEDFKAVVWWLDGAPAAVERTQDGLRQTWLGFAMPTEGDATLRPSFLRFLDWLDSPQRPPFGMAPISDADLRAFAAAPEPPPEDLPIRAQVAPLAPWLLALAILLMLAEPALRRRLADRPEKGTAP